MSLVDLESQLAQGAERVGQGHFKVDSQRALAKLRDFRLADPHHYVLELLRAAEASGATAVHVRNDADDFELSFDGAPFPADALGDLFGCAFHPGADREAARLRFFALGVTGALALAPRFVDVRTGGAAVRVRADGRIAPLAGDAAAGPVDGTRVHVRERAGWRVLREALSSDFPEARALAAFARFFPVPLHVNGRRVSGEPTLSGLLVSADEGAGAMRLIAGLPSSPPEETLLALDVHGVQVVTRSVDLPGAHVVAWARCDALRRNASGSDVVESDRSFVALRDRLEALSDQLVASLASYVEQGDEEARQALARIALQLTRRKGAHPSPGLQRTLAAARLLAGPAGERLCVDDLRKELAAGRPVRTSRVPLDATLYDPPVVLVDEAHLPLVPLLPQGARRDVAEEVRLRLRRIENRRRWAALPVEAPTLPEAAEWRSQFETGGIKGEVALFGDEDGDAVVRFLKSGRLLEERPVPQLRPLRVRAVVDSDLVAPDAAWAAVAEDAGFRKIVEAIRQAARHAVLSGLEQADPPAALRRQGRDLLADLAWWPGDASKLEHVPPVLLRAPLFPLLGGAFASLGEARSWPERRWATRQFSDGLLDGSPVLVLEERDQDSLELLLAGPLTDVRPRLLFERRIRVRIDGPPEPARLSLPTLVCVPVVGEGLQGELGLLAGQPGPAGPPGPAVHNARAEAGRLEGVLVAGGRLRVDFAAAQALLGSKRSPWGVQALVRFLPGGEQLEGPVVRTTPGGRGRQASEVPFDVEVPAEAAEVEIWFRHWVDSRRPQESFDRARGGRWPVGRGESARLHRRLLRRGVLLQQDTVSARYGAAHGVVDCPDLDPAPDWEHVAPGPALDRVRRALAAAQRDLAGALVDWLGGRPLTTAPSGVAAYLGAFLVIELGSDASWQSPDALQSRVFEAPLFTGPGGHLSLKQIAGAAQAAGVIWSLQASLLSSGSVPGFTVVFADEPTRRLLEAVVRRPCQDARERLEEAGAWASLRALPSQRPSLPDFVPLRVPFQAPAVSGVVGYGAAASTVALLVEGRPFDVRPLDSVESWAAACAGLPLCASLGVGPSGLSPRSRELSAETRHQIAQALRVGAEALVSHAARSPGAPHCAPLLLEAIAARPRHGALGGRALLAAPIFPTLSDASVSLEALDALSRVAYSTRPFAADLWPQEPVVLADDERLLRAVGALGDKAVDVTAQLEAEDAAARQRAQAAPVATLEAPGAPARRRRFQARDIEGEVGLGTSSSDALLLLKDRLPLGTVPLGGPLGATAVASCARLPEASAARLQGDAVVAEVRSVVLRQLRGLGAELAAQLPSLAADERARVAPAAARLAAWLARSQIDAHPLLQAKVFRATDGRELAASDLLREQRRRGHVWADEGEGTLLDARCFVWRPRDGERALFGDRLTLADGAKHLGRAREIRSRSTVASLALPQAAWREAVTGEGFEGEVALPSAPTLKLLLHVHRERRLVQVLELDHPVGGQAMVESPRVRVNATWKKVVHDVSFDRLLGVVNAALDRLVLRLLREGRPDDWRPFLPALVGSGLKTPGPLAEALLAAPAFLDLDGQALTVGAVLELASLRGRVPVARGRPASAAAAGDRVVSADDPALALLGRLGLAVEDRTDELAQRAERLARREAHRLESLGYPGQALVRLAVDDSGFTGELALPHPLPDLAQARVVLSRDRSEVDGLRVSTLGVCGVLDHPDLQVNDDWDGARVTAAQHAALGELVRDLFRLLVERFPSFDAERRATAATYLLRFARNVGTTSPEHVDRLSPPASLLAGLKAFRSASGQWVDLRAVADRALRRGCVPVVPFALEDDASEGDLVLRCGSLDEPWIGALEAVLGEPRVARLATRALLREHRLVEDPDDRTPLGAGLRRLRAAARLLHAETFGRLGAEDLREIRVREGDGRAPLSFDAGKGLAVLDGAHPGVRRALEESAERQDGLYVLLAAVYGAVNRAFEHVTDEDEARLAAALLSHLAANPEAPSPPPLPPQGAG